MMRIRNQLAFAIHNFFQSREYVYVHAPLITASDCEGAGELFQVFKQTLFSSFRNIYAYLFLQVTTIMSDDPKKIPVTPEGKTDYSKDFFSAPTFLTVCSPKWSLVCPF